MKTLLRRLARGDRDALNRVIALVYDELAKLARAHLRRETRHVRLETEALIHEAFLRLVRTRHPWYEDRAHFYGIASRVMRQVLVDHARTRAAEKRGPGRQIRMSAVRERVPPPNRSLMALRDALRHLRKTDGLKATVIEMRYFGGMTAQETAAALRLPVRTIRHQLLLAQKWLRKELTVLSDRRR